MSVDGSPTWGLNSGVVEHWLVWVNHITHTLNLHILVYKMIGWNLELELGDSSLSSLGLFYVLTKPPSCNHHPNLLALKKCKIASIADRWLDSNQILTAPTKAPSWADSGGPQNTRMYPILRLFVHYWENSTLHCSYFLERSVEFKVKVPNQPDTKVQSCVSR